MSRSWKDLTLDESVERARGVSRQALQIAIRTHTKGGRTDVVDRLRQVRNVLKREKRIAKVGKEVVEAQEVLRAAKRKTSPQKT